MGFKRFWDTAHVWDSWDGTDGTKWIIRDIRPEDDEEAIGIMQDHWCTDETLCKYHDFANNPFAMECVKSYTKEYLGKRMSIGCYEEKAGTSKLVALSVFSVSCKEDKDKEEIVECAEVYENKACRNVLKVLVFCQSKADAFQFLGLDKVLNPHFLVVHRDYRGLGLCGRLLAARQPLALYHGLKGTVSTFTGSASQRCGERAGFTTIATITWKDLAEAGFDYPADETKCIKIMVKKYV